MTRTKSTFLALLAVLLSPMAANAGPIITDVTGGGGPFGTYYGGSDVVGFSFTADVDLTVSALGVWGDGAPAQDGVLNSAHMVGLWTIGGTLLASASVDNTGTFEDGFYFASIASVNLSASMQYVLGALYTDDDGDTYLSGPDFTTTYVSLTEGRYPGSAGLGFVFPSLSSPGNAGRIGPNLMADRTAVPEPGTLALLSLGLLGLGLSRRKKV